MDVIYLMVCYSQPVNVNLKYQSYVRSHILNNGTYNVWNYLSIQTFKISSMHNFIMINAYSITSGVADLEMMKKPNVRGIMAHKKQHKQNSQNNIKI